MLRETVRVRFYGPTEPWVAPLARRFELEDVVEIAGTVSREEALQRQQESQLLLMLCWSDPRETGQHTGKVFEYLGSRRPILAIGGARGVVSELLDETRAGMHPLSRNELKSVLRAWYAEYRSSGGVAYQGDAQSISPYTHREMAMRFADVLEGADSSRGVGSKLPSRFGGRGRKRRPGLRERGIFVAVRSEVVLLAALPVSSASRLGSKN